VALVSDLLEATTAKAAVNSTTSKIAIIDWRWKIDPTKIEDIISKRQLSAGA